MNLWLATDERKYVIRSRRDAIRCLRRIAYYLLRSVNQFFTRKVYLTRSGLENQLRYSFFIISAGHLGFSNQGLAVLNDACYTNNTSKQVEGISSHNPTSDLPQKLTARLPQVSYCQQTALSRLHAAYNNVTRRLQAVNHAAFGAKAAHTKNLRLRVILKDQQGGNR